MSIQSFLKGSALAALLLIPSVVHAQTPERLERRAER